MGVVVQVVVTALLSAALSGVVVWWLWHRILLPSAEEQARVLAEELTADARAELTEAGEALVPQFRQAIRDGIQDAVFQPPTDRIGQTARGMTTAGVNVVEASLRRIFGVGPPQHPPPQPPPR